MIILDMEQGTDEWHQARLGIPTASNFDKIVTSTGAKSKQAAGYMDDLLAGWLMGKPAETYTNRHMERGTELEPDARSAYEFIYEKDVQQVGFVIRDDGLCGCSPDGLIGDDGGLEIKSPTPGVHVSYLRSQRLPAKYVQQVQGAMWICERNWWDFISYHPDMPLVRVPVERDEPYIAKLETAVLAFANELRIQKKMLKG